MSSYLSFKVPRLAVFALTLFLAVSPISFPSKVEAASFSLDSNGTSHIGWLFGGGSTWDNKNASYNGVTNAWRVVGGSSLHGASDYYADDWNWGNGNDDCGKEVRSPITGNVIFSGWSTNNSGSASGFGYTVVIQADANNNFAWRAAHLEQAGLTGASRVNAGDVIGRVGNTSGTNTFTCHLHSVLYKNIFNTTVFGDTAFSRLDNRGGAISNSSGGPDQFAAPFYNDATSGGNPTTDCNSSSVISYEGVRIYDNDNCNGDSKGWASPTSSSGVNLGDSGWNDRADSVHVKSGWSVRVFEHANREGKHQCFTGSKWDLDKDSWEQGGIIGSQISSLIVYQQSNCPSIVQAPGTPSLSSPSNGQSFTDQQAINLSWSGNGSEYYVEISGGPSGTLNTGWIGGTSANIGTQWPGYTYTWRVKARNSGGESGWSSSRTFTVVPHVQVPSAPTLSSPSNGQSFTDVQQINLSWSGNGSEYYVEILGGPNPLNTGWIGNTNVNIGTQWAGHTYTWRVKARNSAGESAWSATRTFTVVPHVQVPSAPSLSSPANGASFTDAQAISLSWSGNGVEYYAEISGGPAGTINTGWISGTTANIGTQWAGHTYTWRVKARNSAGEGSWSGTRTFTVTQAVQIPTAPSLSSPANGATFYDNQDINLSWSGNGTEYFVEVAGPYGVNISWQGGTTRTIGPRNPGSYTWRVKARNSAGEGPWSASRSFTVTQAPDTTPPTGVMTSPAKDSTQNGPNILLKANASDDRSGVKKVQFYGWSDHSWSNSNWVLLGSDNTAPYEYNWNVSNLGAATYAFVSIVVTDNADNSTGILGDSAWTHFSITNTVITAPAAPSLTSPANESSFNVGQSIQLSWTGSGTEYFGEIAGGPNGPITFGWQTTTNKTYTNLPGGYTYTWKIKARNSAGESPWTNSRTFSVGDCNNISGTSIKLFSNQSCRGTVHNASTGFANLTNFNDTAESAYVPAGISARIWSDANRGGATRCITSTMWNFNIDNYENGTKIATNGLSTVSSIEVFNNTTCTPTVVVNPTGCDAVTANGVTLFTQKACGGSSMNVTTSEFTKLVKPNNNAFKSIFVRGGWSIKIFENKDKTGGKTCVKASVKNLAKLTYKNGQPVIRDGKSTISAFQVFNSPNCK